MNTRQGLITVFVGSILLAAAPATVEASYLTASPLAWAFELTPWGDGEPQQVERFSRSVPLPKGGTVVLSNVAGDIVVTGGGGDQVVIEATKRGRTTDAIRNIQIDVITGPDRVEIVTKYPQRTHNAGEVNYRVTVPRRAGLRVKTVSGDVQVSTIDGDLRAESVSGDVRITDAARIEAMSSVSGNVVIRSGAASGQVTVTSISGDVRLTSFKGNALSGSTVSGDLVMVDVTADRVSLKTVSGEVSYAGPLSRTGRYALQSHSGDVVVKLQNATGFELDASSFSGDIHSDVPLTVRFGGDERRRRRQDVRGTYGDGAAMLELKSFSGDIEILNAGGRSSTGAVKK